MTFAIKPIIRGIFNSFALPFPFYRRQTFLMMLYDKTRFNALIYFFFNFF